MGIILKRIHVNKHLRVFKCCWCIYVNNEKDVPGYGTKYFTFGDNMWRTTVNKTGNFLVFDLTLIYKACARSGSNRHNVRRAGLWFYNKWNTALLVALKKATRHRTAVNKRSAIKQTKTEEASVVSSSLVEASSRLSPGGSTAGLCCNLFCVHYFSGDVSVYKAGLVPSFNC
jgi:hypothetical protein